jgi:hypothetical protein
MRNHQKQHRENGLMKTEIEAQRNFKMNHHAYLLLKSNVSLLGYFVASPGRSGNPLERNVYFFLTFQSDRRKLLK